MINNVIFYIFFGLILGFPVSVSASNTEPMTAIDWLADKINDPPEFFTLSNEKSGDYQDKNPEISLNHLPGVSKNSIGLFGGERLGLSINIWSGENETQIADAVQQIPRSELFYLNRLLKRVLLVEADPPITDTKSDFSGQAFLRARILKLITMGALDEAEELIESANPISDTKLLDLWSNIAFLTKRVDEFCNMILERPSEKEFLTHKIICLARSGDWNAAALALATYSSIGDIDENLERLLINYLDHEAELEIKSEEICLEGLPVVVYLCDFSGIRPPDNELPLGFLYTNLSRSKSLRTRISASEEFVKSGALNPTILFSNYKIKRPSTSGGVWARVKLVQELDQEFSMEESEQLELLRNLSLAVQEFMQVHLLAQFAKVYGKKIQNIELNRGSWKYEEMIAALVLLSGEDLFNVRTDVIKNSNVKTAFYLASEKIGWEENEEKSNKLFLQHFDNIEEYELTLLDRVVLEASIGRFPNDRILSEQMKSSLALHRNGALLFKALSLISSGQQSNMLDLQTGLAFLVRMGLLEDFRIIATEILIMEYFRNAVHYY